MRFANLDSLIFPYETFDNDTILISVQGTWSASVFLWVIIQCRSAIFKFATPHRHFQLKEFWLYSLICHESHSLSFCLIKSDHRGELNFGISFNRTGHFVHLWSLDTWMENNSSATSDIEMSRSPYTTNTCSFNIWLLSYILVNMMSSQFTHICVIIFQGGKKAVEVHAAVWVPDSEAVVCMHCKKTQFTVLNRRVSSQ
jgi:hypothetical protein